jgi:hypothetical protein
MPTSGYYPGLKKVLGKKNLATCETSSEFIAVWNIFAVYVSLSYLNT